MRNRILAILFVALIGSTANAQFDPVKGCIVDSNGDCIPNTILTAMPFLRIAPDARGGAMGDAGIAGSPDANSMFYNPSNLAFVEDDSSLGATYTPWLRDLNLNDIYLAYLSGYKKIDDLSTLGFNFRFFSLGEINFIDPDGIDNGVGKPREFEVAAAYARKLGDNFSIGLSGKYIYSNLASGQNVNGIIINAASSFATDVSLTYKKDTKISDYKARYGIGMNVSNLGAKVTYTDNATRDFLPTNLGIGGSLYLEFDEYNTITFLLDMNKLLTPTPISPTIIDANGNDVENPDYEDYRTKSLFEGVFGSFTDAQGGGSEELSEVAFSTGAEYWYDKQFAVRAGYYYESPLKGDRQFMTIGIGLKYNIFGIDLSYLVPTNNRRSPLDNTLRFGMTFDLANLESLDE